MPGKVGVKIKAGRNLPVMDRGSDTTDAFVEIKLGKWTHKTDVCRKSLNPQWNTDWFRFEVDDAEIQDEPLQIRLMDYDTYSANDAIGKVNISLNPLCLETATGHGKGTVLSGWIPVFDTMHGIRGEVNIIVKVDLFSDVNKFRQSSCGIPFFHSPCIPNGYRAQVIHGFVEELVVNDDPEYQWIDKIRTPRASNEARQVVFLKLSGQVQRKMGLKAINLGANAVIGFMQCFDLEGDVGVVARGIGTAVTLVKDNTIQSVSLDNSLIKELNKSVLINNSCKLPASYTSLLFTLKSGEESLYSDETDVMQILMRQEDERGEHDKLSVHHTIKQQMRRLKHSSQYILQLFKSKIDGTQMPTSEEFNASYPQFSITSQQHEDNYPEIMITISSSEDDTKSTTSNQSENCDEDEEQDYIGTEQHISDFEQMLGAKNFKDNLNSTSKEYEHMKKRQTIDMNHLAQWPPHVNKNTKDFFKTSQPCLSASNINTSELYYHDTSKSMWNIFKEERKSQDSNRTLEEIKSTTIAGSNISTQPVEADTYVINGDNGNNNNEQLNENHTKLSNNVVKLMASQMKTTDNILSNDNHTITGTGNDNKVGEHFLRSSDSDLSVTPIASDRLVAATAMMRVSQPTVNVKVSTNEGMDMLEYPFLTLTKYPPGFVLNLGATVAARSVKLLERVPNPDEPEVRDSWWTELRMEIRSHTRALGCNVVLGYSESTTISDEVCVLSATGTAAVINMAYNRSISQNEINVATGKHGGIITVPIEEQEENVNGVISAESIIKENMMSHSYETSNNLTKMAAKKRNMTSSLIAKQNLCSICHVPYNLNSLPFNGKLQKCAICRKGRVPDVLLTTLEVPENLQLTGYGCFMQAQVVRTKKDLRSEGNAKEISDALPFLEYELHRVLINKLKAKGMNAIFALKTQMAVGERLIALVATGTAIFISALPVPQVPKIIAGNSWTDKQKLNELQNKLHETFVRNQEIYQLKSFDGSAEKQPRQASDTDESEDEMNDIDMNHGNKDTCVLEVDDVEDLEIITSLMESYPPEGFYVVNTQCVPGMVALENVKNLQMFTQVWRAKLDMSCQNGLAKHFQRLLQTIFFKLRAMIPCAICDLRFRLDLPETDQIQLLVTGMALGLNDSNKFKYITKACNNSTTDSDNDGPTSSSKRSIHEEDYIFPLEEDQMVETPTPTNNVHHYGHHSFKGRKYSPVRKNTNHNLEANNKFQLQLETQRRKNLALGDRYGVNISPLTFIPGARIDKYLGNLNFFFIRESTSIRENGGISGFVHSFITEILGVVRAHILSLGGNAMVSFYMTELLLVDNQHKNQGQCLISIGGDAVSVSYTPEG